MNLKVYKTDFFFFFYQQNLCEYEGDFCSEETFLTRAGTGEPTGRGRGPGITQPGVKTRSSQNRRSRPLPQHRLQGEPVARGGSNRYSGAGGGSPGMWGSRAHPGARSQRRAVGPERPSPPPRRRPPGPAGKPRAKFAQSSGAALEAPAAVSPGPRGCASPEGLWTLRQPGAHGPRTMSPPGRAASGGASGRGRQRHRLTAPRGRGHTHTPPAPPPLGPRPVPGPPCLSPPPSQTSPSPSLPGSPAPAPARGCAGRGRSETRRSTAGAAAQYGESRLPQWSSGNTTGAAQYS